MRNKDIVFVIGHKNPDTDSVCSAIAYANLKNILAERNCICRKYVPKRAGHINAETQFVLDRLHLDAPGYVESVQAQVKDIDVRETEGISDGLSLKKAWSLMRDQAITALPVTNGNKLIGLITVRDIATSYMDVYESTVLGQARTQYSNILETLDGNLLVGNSNSSFADGKVLIAAANPDLMENYIEKGDLVILGNRYESQLCAIEMNAGCIIVCEGAKVSVTIQKLAEEKGCTIISSPHDTFTVARLINQSMPISYFMKSQDLITFQEEDYLETVRDVMAKKRHRDFPILDKQGNYAGMLSRRLLLNTRKKNVILVDHNEQTQTVEGIEDANILEIIDHHRIGSLETMSPVFFRNQPLGCTATIVYQMYQENNVEVDPVNAALLCSAILSDTLMYRSPTCTETDRETCEELARIAGISVEQYAKAMFKAGSNLSGKTPAEIFNQDFKTFTVGDLSFGVGQINAMTEDELMEIKETLLPYLEDALKELRIDMVFFMLTDIINESTHLLHVGKDSGTIVEAAFSVEEQKDTYYLPGVISRKKQLIPTLMTAMQQ